MTNRGTNGTTPTKVQLPQQPTDEEEDEQNDEQVLAAPPAPTSEVVVVKDATRELVYLMIAILATIALVGTLLVEMQVRGGLVEIAILCGVAVIGVVAWLAVMGISQRDHNGLKYVTAIVGLAALIAAVVVLIREGMILPTGQSSVVVAVVKNVTDLASKK